MEQKAGKTTKHNLSEASTRLDCRNVTSIFNDAVTRALITKNPFKLLFGMMCYAGPTLPQRNSYLDLGLRELVRANPKGLRAKDQTNPTGSYRQSFDADLGSGLQSVARGFGP